MDCMDDFLERYEKNILDLHRLKEENARLQKKNIELAARWDNLNDEVFKKHMRIRTDVIIDPARYTRTLSLRMDFDEHLLRASTIDLAYAAVEDIWVQIREKLKPYGGVDFRNEIR